MTTLKSIAVMLAANLLTTAVLVAGAVAYLEYRIEHANPDPIAAATATWLKGQAGAAKSVEDDLAAGKLDAATWPAAWKKAREAVAEPLARAMAAEPVPAAAMARHRKALERGIK